MHLGRMLNSSSSSPSPSSSSSSSSASSSLSSSNHLPKPPVSASSSSSSNPISSPHHHLQLPPSPPLHPALLTTPLLPHYHHLHHLPAYPTVPSTHHLHPYPSIDPTHRLYLLPHTSLTARSLNVRNSGNVNERLSNHVDPHCQAPIQNNISNSVLSSSENTSSRHYSACYTTDCSPRSVIRHVQSSSSAPSPDPCRPTCHYTNPSNNAGASLMTTPSHQGTDLSTIARLHHSTPHETGQGAFSLVHKQSAVFDQHRLPLSWNSPTAVHHHYYDLCSNFKVPSTRSGHNNFEGGEGGTGELHKRGEMKKGPKLLERGSRSADLHEQRKIEQFKSGYFSGSAVEDKPCMNIESNNRAGYGSMEPLKQTVAAVRIERGNQRLNVNKCTATKPMYKSTPNSMHIDHGHKLHMERSFTCDLHSSKYCAKCSTDSSASQGMKQAGSGIYRMKEQATKSPDALREYGDGLANSESYCNTRGRAQLGSKWEDADKWVRPINYQYDSGCRGFANLGLPSCMNSGTGIKSNHMHYGSSHVPQPILGSDCISNYSSDFTPSSFANYSSRSSFSNSSSATLSALPDSMPSLARQTLHVDCFKPHLSSSNPHLPYAPLFSPYAQLATDQQIEEKLSKQRSGGSEQSSQHLQESYTGKARQQHYASAGSGISNMASKLARDNYNGLHCGLNSQEIQAPNKEASLHFTSHQLITDRFASGEVMCHTPQVLYARHNDENLFEMPTRQRGVPMPMVLLREVGTQISSIDGSGSISRFTSKNGSPQKSISPARHNTPAYMRSLNGSTNSINHIREVGKQAIDLEELVNCHRAKLELQAWSEGDRIHSFHRTISNWSSREIEEADLSRSLRHSTELDEHHNTKNNPWPSQSYSWNKDEESKLAKLQGKEARIKAWEDKKKSKADAQLKRLEESLAKKRAQTTNRIIGNLGAAQRKAEEMRASVYAQQKRATSKIHRFQHRSLSPLSCCICFSPSAN